MSALLSWLEATSLAAWTRESPSLWAYPTILTAHTIGLSVVVGLNAVIDLRLLGFARRIQPGSLMALFGLIGWAFALNTTTGLLLFMADANIKARQPILYLKLTAIALALWCVARSRRLLRAEVEPANGVHARALALASLGLWAVAIAAGRLMAYL